MIELLGKSLEELQSIFKTHNIQKFRAKQLIDYIYHRYIFDFEEMTQFPKELRQWLSDNCVISLPTLITESVSPDGKTRKILVEMTDQSRVEAVLWSNIMDTLYVFLLKLAVPWAVCSAPLRRVVYIVI